MRGCGQNKIDDDGIGLDKIGDDGIGLVNRTDVDCCYCPIHLDCYCRNARWDYVVVSSLCLCAVYTMATVVSNNAEDIALAQGPGLLEDLHWL